MPETVVRAFELPVQAVEAGGRDGWALLRECWSRATDLANWSALQLLRADQTRLAGMEKLPPAPRLSGKRLKGLYGLASETFGFTKPGSWWSGACISASSIVREVERKYLSERGNVLWRRCQAPVTYSYPHPWPVHSQAWKVATFEGGKPVVVACLPGGIVKFRLRGGPEFGRQLGLFRQVAGGSLPKLQLVVRQQGASNSCHRPTVWDGGRERRVMVKMVARLPVKERPGDRCLVLSTDPSAFWVAELDGRPAWVLNADHVRFGLAAHEAHLVRLQRLSQDCKAERRLCSNRDVYVARRLEKLCVKHARRMSSWLHESAAHLAGFACRSRVGEVFYLNRGRGFLPKFPWRRLHDLLADKLRAAGVSFFSESSAGAVPETEGGSRSEGPAEFDLKSEGREEDDRWIRVTKLRENAGRKVVASLRRSGSSPAVSKASATSPTRRGRSSKTPSSG